MNKHTKSVSARARANYLKALNTIAVAAPFVICLIVGGSAAEQDHSSKAEIYFPHEHVQKFLVTATNLPYEKQLLMREHDAVVFILPDQRPVSVWCSRPDAFFPLAEQQTKSGLKTEWGEKPWIKPRMKYKKELANSYSSDGWDSYIEQGSVTTTGERQSEYVLYIDFMRFSIVEDLSATDGLPVTIKIARTTRQPRSRNESNADPSRR